MNEVLEQRVPGVFSCAGSRFEPGDGQVYHGAQGETTPLVAWDDKEFPLDIRLRMEEFGTIEGYVRAQGHRPVLIMMYLNITGLWGDPRYYARKVVDTIRNHAYPYIPQVGIDWAGATAAQVAEGRFDAALTDIARMFAEAGFPIFVRPGYEFGPFGIQKRWTDPKDFPRAFRHVVDVFRQAEALNVAFIWNTVGVEQRSFDYMQWYPGDEHVDWWGVNLFERTQIEGCGRFLQDAQSHGKPVMVCESTPRFVGVTDAEECWEKWFAPFFQLIRTTPGIKAFCYINSSWAHWRNWSDSRVETNAELSDLYAQEMSDPAYLHMDTYLSRFFPDPQDLEPWKRAADPAQKRARILEDTRQSALQMLTVMETMLAQSPAGTWSDEHRKLLFATLRGLASVQNPEVLDKAVRALEPLRPVFARLVEEVISEMQE